MQTQRVAIIVVSGPPASGKTWWGRRLSREFGVPYLNRDDFKVPIYPLAMEHGVPPDVAAQATREAWLVAVAAVLDAGLAVIADGVFNNDLHVDGFRRFVRERKEQCFELRLTADADTLLRRFEERADPPLTEALMPGLTAALGRSFQPIVPGSPSIALDTTDWTTLKVSEVVASVGQWITGT